MLRASCHPERLPKSHRYSDHPADRNATSTDMDALASHRPARMQRAGLLLCLHFQVDRFSRIPSPHLLSVARMSFASALAAIVQVIELSW